MGYFDSSYVILFCVGIFTGEEGNVSSKATAAFGKCVCNEIIVFINTTRIILLYA